MTRAAFAAAHGAVGAMLEARPDIRAFAGWPGAAYRDLSPTPLPVTPKLGAWEGEATPETRGVWEALAPLWPLADWRQTYGAEEVGQHFLDNYGYFELLGPTGHLHGSDIRAFVAFWGPGLDYGWHLHEAEELYIVLAGAAWFEAEGGAPRRLTAGATQLHRPNQPHRMATAESAILTLVLWRGGGLGGLPRMGRA